MKAPGGMFRDGKLYRTVTRYNRFRNGSGSWSWCIREDRRQLIHKGRKP